ncbi:MAG: YkgJ family cysteine cluster protein [gamma proteobacterium symbiont of Bathyaustriella thionipta]|nr:YkgJ family cysteine cluster protein [gamma proteobacterium symbiont of Bathyaustriella thionipta]
MSEAFDVPFTSDVMPEMLTNNSKIKFRCHKGISCFNACCKQADITLTPYDIIRLKKRFDIDSSELLKKHTVPFQMDGDGLPGVKMRTDDSGQCLFMTEEGCSVYEDRPTSCRYYPVAHMAMRPKDAATDSVAYALVREDHCKGHEEDRELTIGEYRKEQDVGLYDEMNREFSQLILKKKSAGPTIGKPSELSFQLFFMANYDVDRFRRFVLSPSFAKNYVLDDAFYKEIEHDDLALMKFGFRLLRQILFGEVSIKEREGALEQRVEERQEVMDLRRKVEIERHRQKEEQKWKEEDGDADKK